MIGPLILLGLASGLVLFDGEGPSRPLKVSAKAAPGVHLAGQAIPIRVEVAGSPGSVNIEPPRIGDSVVVRLADQGPDPDQEETTIVRFAVVPRRPGPLVIPPFRARSGTSSGSSTPIHLSIVAVPAAGRPPSFLGGVGDFSIQADAKPISLRAGLTLEYRMRIEGPAAWGSFRPPDLSPWLAKIPGLRIEPIADEGPGDNESPARTFRFRLRPTRAGDWTLPPVAVSAFDPRSRNYLTRFAPGLPIRVDDPPRLDPSEILDHSGKTTESPFGLVSRVVQGLILLLEGLAVALVLGLAWTISRRRPVRDDPRRFARGLAQRLDPAWNAPEAARHITEGLAEYLRRRTDRPPGALTPLEIHDALACLMNDPTFADRGRRLIEDCDRARFSVSDANGSSLVIEAKALLNDLARIGGGWKDGKPREAAETAKP